MSRLIIVAVTAWVVVGLASSRVLEDPPKQDRSSLQQLLRQSDPHENEIFSETVAGSLSATPRAPPRPSPTQHLLESLSRPRYVDASEFRRFEVLPPALDINRQLTLLAASKRIRPPVDFIHPVLTDESSGTIYFPSTFPLFRKDFPVQKIADEQEYLEETSAVEQITQQANETTEEPKISTSVVSVSTSVSYSNDSSTILDIEASSDTSVTDGPFAAPLISTTLEAESSSHSTPSTPSTTTSTSSPTVVSQSTTGSDNASDTPRRSTQIVEAEIVLHPEGSEYPERSGRQLAYVVEADYPDYPDYSDYEAMSPLAPHAHILGGLGSEFDSYGGDFGRSEFISSFRPDGF